MLQKAEMSGGEIRDSCLAPTGMELTSHEHMGQFSTGMTVLGSIVYI